MEKKKDISFIKKLLGGNMKQNKATKNLQIEIRNEMDKTIYVALCKSLLGNLFLHVADRKSKHIPVAVQPQYYEIISITNKETY